MVVNSTICFKKAVTYFDIFIYFSTEKLFVRLSEDVSPMNSQLLCLDLYDYS